MAELPFEYDDYERGLASATKVVELTPDDPEAHQILGRLLVASGDEEAGVESYRRALDLPSNEARAYRELAFDLLELDLFEEASTALERARAQEPDDANTAFTLALALSEAGRLDEATSAFEEAAALAPNVARYHYRLGPSRARKVRRGGVGVFALARARAGSGCRPSRPRARAPRERPRRGSHPPPARGPRKGATTRRAPLSARDGSPERWKRVRSHRALPHRRRARLGTVNRCPALFSSPQGGFPHQFSSSRRTRRRNANAQSL